jgi:hypothetical protein
MNICFPSESNNNSFTTIQFHEVCVTPNLYMFNISLQQNAIVYRFKTQKKSSTNVKYLECLIALQRPLINYIYIYI